MTERFYLARRWASIRCAARGVAMLVGTEHNARIHAAISAAVVLAGLWLDLATAEWCWIVLAMMMVWTAEGLNTALELIADVVLPESNPLIGRAKDVAAGAVLISAVGAALVGLLVFGPRFLERF